MNLNNDFIKRQNEIIKRNSKELALQKKALEKAISFYKEDIEKMQKGLYKELRDSMRENDVEKLKNISDKINKINKDNASKSNNS